MLLVTGRIQLNSNLVLNVVVWDQSLFSLYLSLSQSNNNTDVYLGQKERKTADLQ